MMILFVLVVCLCASTIGGICGIGGGPMNLAVLYYFFSMGTKQAAVNSILIILMSLVTASVTGFEIPVLLRWFALARLAGLFPRSCIRSSLTK